MAQGGRGETILGTAIALGGGVEGILESDLGGGAICVVGGATCGGGATMAPPCPDHVELAELPVN